MKVGAQIHKVPKSIRFIRRLPAVAGKPLDFKDAERRGGKIYRRAHYGSTAGYVMRGEYHGPFSLNALIRGNV